MPLEGYGWEKLFSERMCQYFREDYGLETRVARFNNIYGPYNVWEGGRSGSTRPSAARSFVRNRRDRMKSKCGEMASSSAAFFMLRTVFRGS